MHWEQFQLARSSSALEGKADQGAKLVLSVLISHADPKTAIAFPGRELLAEECCMTEKGVQQIIDKLIERGFISLVKGGVGRKNLKHYLCHSEQGISIEKLAEKENEVSLLLNEKGERGTPFLPENTRKKENGVPIKGERGSNLNNVKGEHGSAHIRNEDKNKDIKSRMEEGDKNSSPSPAELVFQMAICEVCGSNVETMSDTRHRGLQKSIKFLKTLLPFFENEYELAKEVRRRFAMAAWPYREPPNESQIATDWDRQGKILEKQNCESTRKSALQIEREKIRASRYGGAHKEPKCKIQRFNV